MSHFFLADKIKVTDVALKLDLDFERHVLAGSATLALEKVDSGVQQLVRGSFVPVILVR